MLVNFNIYTPAKCTFENYFLPRIKNTTFDHFEVDKKRYGIQRKGNNHLLVFLESHGKKSVSRFSEVKGGEQGDFFTKTPSEAELFNMTFKGQKEVAVFTMTFNPKMFVFAWKLLIEIADDDKVMVEDDLGKWMTGSEYAKALKALLDRG